MTTAKRVLTDAYGTELGNAILQAYIEIHRNYALGNWKPSELDAGHFVEAVRRAIENELFGQYTPISGKLEPFHDGVLKQYEQQSGAPDTFRIYIPRALKAIYNVRNNRGVGHLDEISPNEMDATYILYASKWVLAELIRAKADLKPQETQGLIDDIVEREISLIWKEGGIRRVLDTDLPAKEQVLILLYDESPQEDSALQSTIEYRNTTMFKEILEALHDKRLIEYGADGQCHISPTGMREAEEILEKSREQD